MKVEVVLAPNPGLFTGPGTNTYIVESGGEALILDPGPQIAEHQAAIVVALGDATPVAVMATHTHPDHAPLANPLARLLNVPVLGHSPGPRFVPDETLRDGSTIRIGSLDLVAVATPGHTADHLCLLGEGRLFTGDHIMSGSTVIIEDAAAYMESLYRVRDLHADRVEPGHGPARDDAAALIEEYIDHRTMREEQVLAAVREGAATIGEVTDAIYADVPAALRPAAAHQVHVQLVKLRDDGRVRLGTGGGGASTAVETTESANGK